MAPKRKRQASSQMDDARKSTSTLAVNSILQELLGNSAGSSTAYKKANSEANQGLKSASQSHSRPKAQMVSKSKPARLPNFHFKAGEIIFISCGTRQSKKTSHLYIPLLTPVLRNPQAPTLVEVQTLEVMRLAITDYVDGIIISKNWSFELFDLELRKFFPRLFLYLDALPKLMNPDYKEDQDEIFQYLPQYYLCVKEKCRIVIPPGIQFPDGSSVARNARTNSRGGFRENVVILDYANSCLLSHLSKHPTVSVARSESISSDSEDSSTSSELSLSEPPRKTKSHRVSTETDDEIMPASDSETISESATIVDLTASDDEYTGDFFGSFSLDNHDVVAEPEAPVEADLTPLEPVSSSPLQASVSFVIDPSLDNPPTLQASGSFVLDTSIDNP
ncbi:uncharacterized protein F5891DRAFT_978395 [Suillus fuscotomentosus]|uniref:Uncharacterized protein n=1 Tax=Suillus fuscotomentosus TaxID=1912939 RepID=A0AAD4EB62_9AGAM|nr:uncharacterized protein F5891DRAFT_978395 [Suillus fuscotomentosus]KAG1902946.1 hypothetical protein F5891DRAFT_978395 [Suillus fuscotomentosus]